MVHRAPSPLSTEGMDRPSAHILDILDKLEQASFDRRIFELGTILRQNNIHMNAEIAYPARGENMH